MTIFTPDGTGDTTDKRALLSTLMEWTTDGDIIAAMVRVGAADGEGLYQLALHVKATIEDLERSKLLDGDENALDPQTVPAEVMSEKLIAASLVTFLTAERWKNGASWPDEKSIDAVAAYVSKVYGRRREAALTDLRHLATELRDRHDLHPREIPRFVRLTGDAKELVQAHVEARQVGAQLFRNEDLAYERAPYGIAITRLRVVKAYQDSSATIGDQCGDLLRALPLPLQALARQFPPDCLVYSDYDLICPAPGYMAIVSGYAIEEVSREPIVLVGASDAPDAPVTNALPAWLKLVCCRGQVTREAVAQALESPLESTPILEACAGPKFH